MTFSRSACEEPNLSIAPISRSNLRDFLPWLSLLVCNSSIGLCKNGVKTGQGDQLFFGRWTFRAATDTERFLSSLPIGRGSETMISFYPDLIRLHVVPFNEVQLRQR